MISTKAYFDLVISPIRQLLMSNCDAITEKATMMMDAMAIHSPQTRESLRKLPTKSSIEKRSVLAGALCKGSLIFGGYTMIVLVILSTKVNYQSIVQTDEFIYHLNKTT